MLGYFCRMDGISSYIYIIAACLLVVFSYLYNLISQKTGIPSVLLLLLSGIILREVLIYNNAIVSIPSYSVEVFGIIGLIMIVLEAGLDLQVSKKKLSLYEMLFYQHCLSSHSPHLLVLYCCIIRCRKIICIV